mmetsp:Transcript_11734/g.14589  ORF Transcript_11734/g.14589 Transcript_11734/m.14589 type:complete len:558 (-) Transcript_11734:221-1894(-)|eukprot:CAMPEP_0172513616 /NCGR_PEP_ID=MMETSP1066-20121228/253953_1 /TAXON_ID=671091 /ORGANISM="Coscinodiscus wailesii, Strain CCMP2513" /LENGTH=557 /DNA_ID=CAMNT_0013293959 /DNA_START=52 /DNA_END=1725 /DNA_ORIENTATION=+
MTSETPPPQTPPSIELTEDEQPQPLQIVSVGDASNEYAFTFHEDALNSILTQIPPGWKVSLISVVGAFRTGKSFLLSWFLRYLHYKKTAPELVSEGPDGSDDTKAKWYNQFTNLSQSAGFHWRGGVERNTTGIWVWSEPHFVKRDDENVAVLLIDTQGMFDHDTTMGLTAAIFGLSTLLSSYQIYNVDKKIQEDNLQQLALFSEYGRMALKTDNDEMEGSENVKPFQHIEFLVRDWQHFECDGEGDFKDLEKEMNAYLEQVLEEKNASDLQDTRDQITDCFEEIDCFLLTHPGFAVTKKKYDGDVKGVDPVFLRLLDKYCHRVLDLGVMNPKKIHGREITSVELLSYIKAYANLFSDGAHFPEASTMLDATSHANNVNATEISVREYRDNMDKIAGPNCLTYLKKEEFDKHHEELMQRCIRAFESKATFGNQKKIEEFKEKVIQQVREMHEMYEKLNESRNPFAGMETVLIPLIIGIIAYILRKVSDGTCSSWSQTCKASSDILSEVQIIVSCFILIVSVTKAKQFKVLIDKLVAAYRTFSGAQAQPTASTETKKTD